MRTSRLVVVTLAALAVGGFVWAQEQSNPAPEQGVGGSAFHKNDITYSTEVVTPHVEWASKLPGGPVKGFFIPSIEFGRDMVELMQRMPIEPTTDSIDRNWDTNCWGIGDYYGHQYRGNRDDFRIVHNYVERDLTGPAKFDVMVIPGLNGWSRLTKATRDAVLKRVEDGAGLVLIHPFVGDIKGHPFNAAPLQMENNASREDEDAPIGVFETEYDTRIWDVSPLVDCLDDSVSEKGYPVINKDAVAKGTWQAGAKHFITSGLPVELLPEGSVGGEFYKYRAAGDVLIKSGDYPILAVKNYGKGRVVALAYVEEGFTPKAIDPIDSKIAWDYWEYQYALLAKSIIWAAGRDSGMTITSLSAAPSDSANVTVSTAPVAGAKGVTIALSAKGDRAVEIEVSGHNEFGQDLGTRKEKAAVPAGDSAVVVDGLKPSFGWPGGKNIFNVMVRDASTGETLDFGAAVFETPKVAQIENVVPAATCYQPGETLSAKVQEAGAFLGMTTRLTVTDDLDRVVGVVEKPARQERYFAVSLDDYVGKYAFVSASLVDAKGAVVDQVRVKPILVVQGVRRQKEFQATLAFAGGKTFLTSTQTRLVRAGGAMSGFTWGGGVDNGLNIPRGTFGVYWYDRGPTSAEGIQAAIDQYQKDGDFEAIGYLTRKELYKRTADKKFLARVPCFDDRAFMKTLYDIVHATARSKAQYNLDYYFVGDEGSLTSYSDPFDLCWSPYTLAGFRKWLQGQYPSLEALNAEWKTDYKSWDDVMPYTPEEATAKGSFAPWADHRTYMEIAFANAYKTVRDAVVAGDPDGHIAVSGTQATTSYDGCDWYRLDQVIDDFLAYGGGNQWDLHRSFAKPGAMIGFWTGYGSSGLGVQNAIWSAAIHNVLFPNIFWMSSYLNPDLTYSKSARDMGTAFKALKFEGVGRLFMESKRLQDGIALHYSMPSYHASTITAPQGSQERGRMPQGHSLQGDQNGWVRAIKELGMQFDFVSYDQVPKGKLSNGDYKVFVLPLSTAISPDEAKAIRKFVEDGGTVIGDAMTGVMDDHCGWREEGLLNDLFGIAAAPSSKRQLTSIPVPARPAGGQAQQTPPPAPAPAPAPQPSPEVIVTPEGAKWGLDAKELAGIEAVEANVKPSPGKGLFKRGAAKSLLKIGDTDAVIVRKVGKGRAIYLNVLLDRMGGGFRRRGAPAEGPNTALAYQALVQKILAGAGVKPAISVVTPDGKAVTRAVIARYRFGDSTVLAMVKEMSRGESTGMDGVTYYTDASLGKVAKQELTIRLGEKMHVNDVRTGESLGETDTVKTSIMVGGALVLGLTKTANAVEVSGPAAATLGDQVAFAIKSSDAGKHLVRCHFSGPDGAFLPAYARNVVVEGGTGKVVLASALNDAAGNYTLKVADVVTGASAETKVTLK